MLAPELHFMVHSSEVIDEEGYAHRGSRIVQLDAGAPEPPEWRSRDFAFAAYSGAHATGLRRVLLGKWSIWAFASPREHCEEIAVFRKGSDARRKWDEDALTDEEVAKGMFFVMRSRHITGDTPLGKQFNGEWGFWESFFVPLIDEGQSMKSLSLMDPAMVEDFFSVQRLPVTCYKCPEGQEVLKIPKDLVVTYQVKMACKEMSEWTNLCTKIGDDMIMQEPCLIEHKHLRPGDECIEAYHEQTGIEEHARLIKRDLEQLKLPIIATFRCRLKAADWDEDLVSLQYKFDFMHQIYSSNLMGGFSSLSGSRSDPWNPMARLALNALTKLLARYPDIRTVMDVGCGDMSWIQYFLQDHPLLAYVGVDIMPQALALNFRRFPRLQFVQTDLSNQHGVEVLPRGCDLVIAKDVFNHMTLPDAVSAVRRIVNTRPRFLLTHVHGAADNTGWEKRIDKHLHYTRYDYNKAPFCLPFPCMDIQRISDEAYFIVYEISPEGAQPSPPRTDRLRPPPPPSAAPAGLDSFSLFANGTPTELPPLAAGSAAAGAAGGSGVGTSTASGAKAPRASPSAPAPAAAPATGAASGVGERTALTKPVTELPDAAPSEAKAALERKPIKGLPPVEFRARCDLIFGHFDTDGDGALRFEEVAALMAAGGRAVDTREAFESLCSRLGCDAAAGLDRKDLHRFFEKAPMPLWDEVYRSVDPLAGLVRRGAEKLPETFLERPLPDFLFEDSEQFAQVYVELNAHIYYGAAEHVTKERVQAHFGAQRMELFICAPSAFGAQDLCRWRLSVAPLGGEVVPEDCFVELKETTGRFGSQRLEIKLMKASKRKWYKVGQVSTGQRGG